MVSRMCLILWVLESKCAFWLYEQPQTSLLFEYPRMQSFLKRNVVYKVHMWMGSYGAATPKGTHLWGPTESLLKFALPLPKKEWDEQLVSKKVMPDGRIQVTGNALLKGSQSYPKAFGEATLCVWKVTPKRALPSVSKIPNVWLSPSQDKWPNANLSEVMQFLSLGTLK